MSWTNRITLAATLIGGGVALTLYVPVSYTHLPLPTKRIV